MSTVKKYQPDSKEKEDLVITKNMIRKAETVTTKIPVTDLVTPSQEISRHTSPLMLGPQLQQMAQLHGEQKQDSLSIYHMLPDLHLAKETLVSNIISPTDLQHPELNITVDTEAPPEITEELKKHFHSDEGYNLNKMLPDIIGESLVEIGAYIQIPIPPSAVRKIIKNHTYGLENLGNGLSIPILPNLQKVRLPRIGLISGKTPDIRNVTFSVSLESCIDDTIQAIREGENDQRDKIVKGVKGTLSSFKKELTLDNELVEITDNPMYLVQTELKVAVNEFSNKIINQSGWGLESKEDAIANQYKDRMSKLVPFMELTKDDNAVDNFDPIVMKIPFESYIPVIDPSTGKHLGGYLLIDLDGHFLKYSNYLNKFKQLSDRLDRSINEQPTTVSYSFGVSYPNTSNFVSTERSNTATLLAAYEEKFETELKELLKNGSVGLEVEVAKVENIYRMMFARQLSKQRTRLIYVSAEMVSYLAYNYDDFGVGQSLIEKTKLYSSFRATLTFAQMMAAMKSAINRTLVTVTLDEKEIDPRGTVELLRNEMAGLIANGFPFGKYQPADIVDSVLKSGIQMQVNGPQYPDTKVEIQDQKRDIVPPSTELQDWLKEIQYQGFGLSLDLMEKANSLDFMGQIDNINLLQSKRNVNKQLITENGCAEFIQKYLRCKGKLYKTLETILTKNNSKLTMVELINSIKVTLPKADYAQHKAQAQTFSDYVAFVSDVIDSLFSETEMSGLLKGDNISNEISAIKLILLNEAKRRFLKSKNMLPEVFELITDTDKTLMEILKTHIDSNITLTGNISREVLKSEHKDDEKTEKLNEQLNPPPEEETDDTDQSTLTDEGGDENTDDTNPDDTKSTDDTGGDDLGLGDDTGVDENENLDTEESTDEETDVDETDKTSKSKKDEDKETPDETDEDLDLDIDTDKDKTKDKKDKT